MNLSTLAGLDGQQFEQSKVEWLVCCKRHVVDAEVCARFGNGFMIVPTRTTFAFVTFCVNSDT